MPTDDDAEIEALRGRVCQLEEELAAGTPSAVRPDCRSCELDAAMTEKLLDKAMSMASLGAWSIDMSTGRLTWSDEVFRIHELPVGEPPAVDDAIHFYAPEVRSTIQSALDRLVATGETFDIELPLITAKGNRVWVRSIGDLERDSAGDPSRLYGVFQDITSQVVLNQERERARQEAESATRAKSEFLATMSHEIRTPLNGILGMAQVIEQTDLDAEQRDYLRAIQASGSSLLVLLNDILDLSKIEAGRMTIERVAFDLEALLRESVDMLTMQSGEKDSVEMRVVVDDALRGAWIGDPVRVRQVVLNLLGNALKFTEHGHVELRAAAASGGRIRIEVEDTGIGVDHALRDHLFEVFQQADASTTRRFGGSGLGLAICRRLVDRMEGEIGMESEPGEGSIFWFELPVERAATASFDPAGALRDGSAPAALGSKPGRTRVLVVEDNPVNQVVARKLVEALGCEVTLASNGEEGVEAALAADFDLILMDCQMPVLDGYEATRRLRRMEAEQGRAHVPVVAMTANAMDGDRDICIDAGMDDYLAKPVDRERLEQVLRSWVAATRRTAA